MNYLYFASIVFVQISSITSEWRLSFSDNFNESLHFDKNKWDISDEQSQFIKMIDGNLAISADRRIQESEDPSRPIISARYAQFNEGNNV